jgi:hypothetical protein
VALLALALLMLPPPHAFINVQSARLVDKHTLEIAFEWPRCADEKSIRADWAGAAQAPDGSWDVRFSLQERRSHPNVPTCAGPTEKQVRRIDLTTLLGKDMTHGRLQVNDPSLYGVTQKLPAIVVAFDLR